MELDDFRIGEEPYYRAIGDGVRLFTAAYAERIAPRIAYILSPLLKILYPVVWFVHLFVTPLLLIFRVRQRGALLL